MFNDVRSQPRWSISCTLFARNCKDNAFGVEVGEMNTQYNVLDFREFYFCVLRPAAGAVLFLRKSVITCHRKSNTNLEKCTNALKSADQIRSPKKKSDRKLSYGANATLPNFVL